LLKHFNSYVMTQNQIYISNNGPRRYSKKSKWCANGRAGMLSN
jgi:hypothetical protein